MAKTTEDRMSYGLHELNVDLNEEDTVNMLQSGLNMLKMWDTVKYSLIFLCVIAVIGLFDFLLMIFKIISFIFENKNISFAEKVLKIFRPIAFLTDCIIFLMKKSTTSTHPEIERCMNMENGNNSHEYISM